MSESEGERGQGIISFSVLQLITDYDLICKSTTCSARNVDLFSRVFRLKTFIVLKIFK